MLEGKEVVMTLFHKLTYVSTGGMIDLRSDRERVEDYSKKIENEHKNAAASRARRCAHP